MKSSRILAPFSRVTSGRTFIPEIDGLRFVAIFTVVLYHLNTHFVRTVEGMDTSSGAAQAWEVLVSRLGLGVQVFFAISGFILALPFARHHLLAADKPRLRPYFWRRLTRLEPPYLISLAVLFAGGIVMGEYSFREGLPHLGASVVYLHNIIYDAWSTINPVAWSLEVEVQFYILAPVLSLIFAIRSTPLRRGIMVGIILASVLWSYYALDFIEDIRLRKSLLNNLHFFYIGFLLADVFLKEWQQAAKRAWLGDIAGILALPLLWWGAKLNPINASVFLLGVGLLFVGAFRGHWVRRFFQNPWIATIGGMCYSIYLLHYAGLAILMRFTQHLTWGEGYLTNYVIQCLVVLPILLVGCALFFRFFERPFMYKDWPQRLRQRLQKK